MFRFSLLLLLGLLSRSVVGLKDNHDNCAAWADMGECDSNPDFMLVSCAASCDRFAKEALASSAELEAIGSFFDLSAKDIDGNVVTFDEFEGKVTILTNVASYCGYTESHYKGLVELWSNIQNEAVEILAFPCNQFGKQEPGTAEEIKDFASSKGVRFRIMEKIDVNGPNASIVYKYLKKEAGPKAITWNFATYFVVGPNGKVTSYSGVQPTELEVIALGMLKDEL